MGLHPAERVVLEAVLSFSIGVVVGAALSGAIVWLAVGWFAALLTFTIDFDTAGSDDSEFRFVGISDPSTVVAAVDRAQASVRDPNLA